MEGLDMPLKPLKENATQEEINAWIVEAQEEYNKIETDLSTYKDNFAATEKRVKDLETANQRLFLKVTKKVTDEEDQEETIPAYITKEVYDTLSDKEKKLLKEIEEGEDE